METRTGNIAVMPATSRLGLERGAAMTREQFEREKKYQAALAVAKAMLKNGIINDEDYRKIEEVICTKFCPFLGTFRG